MRIIDAKTSLMVSTYNRPDALKVCLKSIKKQSVLPKEVIIGDDGSTEETKQLIGFFQKDFPVPLIHVWQEDRGFRLAACRNKAIMACTGEYIIQIDGDIVLHHRFIEDHIRLSEKGYFLRGRRVNIKKNRTGNLCKTGELLNTSFFSAGLVRRTNAIHSRRLSHYFKDRYKINDNKVLGANLSYWKEDFLKVNGYDEFFEGWGAEDLDFTSRLLQIGVKKRALKFAAIGFHLWHEERCRKNEEKNHEYVIKVKERGTYLAAQGADQYSIEKIKVSGKK